jgi:tetratricopeptide (TPR) repeat protein
MINSVVTTIAVIMATGLAHASDANWEICTKGTGKTAIDACSALVDGKDSAAAYLNRGATYFVMKEYKRSEADLTHAIERNPQGPRAWKTRGKARMWLKDYSLALADFKMSLSLPLMNTDDFKEQRHDTELWQLIAELALAEKGK